MARKGKEGSEELEVRTNRQRRDLESQSANGQTDHRVGLLVLQLPAAVVSITGLAMETMTAVILCPGRRKVLDGCRWARRQVDPHAFSRCLEDRADHALIPAQPLPLWKCQSEAGLVLGRRVPQEELRSLDRFIERDGGIQGE